MAPSFKAPLSTCHDNLLNRIICCISKQMERLTHIHVHMCLCGYVWSIHTYTNTMALSIASTSYQLRSQTATTSQTTSKDTNTTTQTHTHTHTHELNRQSALCRQPSAPIVSRRRAANTGLQTGSQLTGFNPHSAQTTTTRMYISMAHRQYIDSPLSVL